MPPARPTNPRFAVPYRITVRTLRSTHCTLRTSFLAYLGHATPYVGPNEESSRKLLDELIAQQKSLADRVAGQIRELGSEEGQCDFPAEFTAAHDLGIGYSLRRAAKDQRGRVDRLAELRLEQSDPRAESLLDEVVHHADAIAGQLERATEPDSKQATPVG